MGKCLTLRIKKIDLKVCRSCFECTFLNPLFKFTLKAKRKQPGKEIFERLWKELGEKVYFYVEQTSYMQSASGQCDTCTHLVFCFTFLRPPKNTFVGP